MGGFTCWNLLIRKNRFKNTSECGVYKLCFLQNVASEKKSDVLFRFQQTSTLLLCQGFDQARRNDAGGEL